MPPTLVGQAEEVRPAGGWGQRLFPEPPRRVPHERAWNVALRTLHLMAFAVLVGGHVLRVEPERLVLALGLTLATGAALMALELYKTAEWLFLLKGLAVLLKLALLLVVPFLWGVRGPLLLAVVALSSVGAHMPSRYRHYSVRQGRVLGPYPASLPR